MDRQDDDEKIRTRPINLKYTLLNLPTESRNIAWAEINLQGQKRNYFDYENEHAYRYYMRNSYAYDHMDYWWPLIFQSTLKVRIRHLN